jgi:chorismate--pyruvate lyase
MVRAAAHGRWFSHVNAVHPSPEIRHWLTDKTSLTVKLISRSGHFRVQRLSQKRALCLADEFAAVGLSRRALVSEREVLLRCDDVPVVFAHTIVPLTASASDWPFFGALGEGSLGATLFGDPQVIRGALQFARLQSEHPLVRRALQATGIASDDEGRTLYARRCLFRRKRGTLLVTEVFLPKIAGVRSLAAM